MTDLLRDDAERSYQATMAAIQAVDVHLAMFAGGDALTSAEVAHALMRAELDRDFTIRLIDEAGYVLDWPRGTVPARFNVLDRDYVRALRDGHDGWFVGAPATSRLTGRDFVTVARRASKNSHEVAIVTGVIDIDPVLGRYERVRPGPNGAVGLFRTDGVLLARVPHDPDAVGRRLSGPLFEALRRAPDGVFDAIVQTDGKRRITAYRSVGELPLVVAAGFAVDDVLAEWRRENAIYAIFVLTFSVSTIGLLAYRSRSDRREALLIARSESARLDAERANAAKSRFLARMSHELRSPLNAILGFSQIIEQKMFGGDTERYANYAGDIHKSAEHLLSLVSDMLDMAAIEAGQTKLTFERLALAEILAEVLRLTERSAQARGITQRLDVAPDATIIGDRRAVFQIATNLLTNAIKYGPSGAPVGASVECDQDLVKLHIDDSGRGIPADVVGKIGTPFGKDGDPWVRSEGGVGLGLSITRALASMHGGGISFGRGPLGNRVTIAFPRRGLGASDEAALGRAEPSPTGGAGAPSA